jgi:hypothetical protein
LILWFVAACVFSGCVHVAGTAGYWHADAERESQNKQVSFDTANLVSKDKDPESNTV